MSSKKHRIKMFDKPGVEIGRPAPFMIVRGNGVWLSKHDTLADAYDGLEAASLPGYEDVLLVDSSGNVIATPKGTGRAAGCAPCLKGRASGRLRSMAGKKKSAASEAKAQKKNATYPAVRADAQKRANATGFDHGLEWNDIFGSWNVFMLPARQNRSGHELRAEVVSPENIEKTQPGHGYGRSSGRKVSRGAAARREKILSDIDDAEHLSMLSGEGNRYARAQRISSLYQELDRANDALGIPRYTGPDRAAIDLLAKGRASGRTTPTCTKKIRVQRKGYTRRDGTVVKPTTFTQCDPGLPGRRTRGSKAGPYKKQPKWVQKPGTLGGLGYAKRPEHVRHQILRDAVEFYTYASTARKLHVILRSTTIHPDTRKVVERDIAWLRAQYRGKDSNTSGRSSGDTKDTKVRYLTKAIAEVRHTNAPRQGAGLTKDGYTKRSGAPTATEVRLEGEKIWRRVYVWQFGTGGTRFVRVQGKPLVIPTGTVL